MRMFQFLMSTIKTISGSKTVLFAKNVSIPYRYDKNRFARKGGGNNANVSIPYRYDKNYQAAKPVLFAKNVSIPYRYDKNQRF